MHKGDLVEVVPGGNSGCIGIYYFIGDRGVVREEPLDNIIHVDFNGQGNKKVNGRGFWWIINTSLKLVPKVEIEVGDIVEIIPGKCTDFGKYFFVGDRAVVVSVDRYYLDMDFNGRNNKEVVREGVWFVPAFCAKIIQKGLK